MRRLLVAAMVWAGAAGVAGIAVVPREAIAQEGLPLGWSMRVEDDRLHFTVDADEEMTGLKATLRRAGDGRTERFERKKMEPGGSWTFSAPMPPRSQSHTLTIEGSYGGVKGRVEDTFEVSVQAPMEFELVDGIDLEGRRLRLRMSQDAGHAEVTVRGDDGRLLAERVVKFGGEAPGTPLEVSWTQPPGNVLTIDLRVVSASGAWVSRQFIPWSVEVAVENVNFPSGSAEIPEEEKPKLLAGYRDIAERISRVREWVQVRLYIAGYTDTVGSDADNQRLSEARARSLAMFMKSQGIDAQIHFQGFGESGLLVETGDAVDEPKNRRAAYVLSVEPPPTSRHFPRSGWKRLE